MDQAKPPAIGQTGPGQGSRGDGARRALCTHLNKKMSEGRRKDFRRHHSDVQVSPPMMMPGKSGKDRWTIYWVGLDPFPAGWCEQGRMDQARAPATGRLAKARAPAETGQDEFSSHTQTKKCQWGARIVFSVVI